MCACVKMTAGGLVKTVFQPSVPSDFLFLFLFLYSFFFFFRPNLSQVVVA